MQEFVRKLSPCRLVGVGIFNIFPILSPVFSFPEFLPFKELAYQCALCATEMDHI